MQDTVVVPDAESALNGIDKGPQDVVTAPMEISLSQNHPRDNADNGGVCHVPPSSNTDRASNSVNVQIEDDEEPYKMSGAIDSDDDRPLMRCFCPNIDPLVPEFSDLRDCDGAFAEGRDDEILDAPDVGDNMQVRKGLVFKDLTTLKRWLQEYAVKRKRPFKVTHSYVERRYTVGMCSEAKGHRKVQDHQNCRGNISVFTAKPAQGYP
ncbi:hypothetical protein PVAP13_9NG534614 [Panicum virgatum]|uniref:Transposase MuDR plant domain-containing protein n=1 Tax=Panicum virgatum TaxID=38727 RepID=A0A8T0MZF6_PANVG|nr:hypothetical protein PVAP13_9NG534614 [Panicum virgatum]